MDPHRLSNIVFLLDEHSAILLQEWSGALHHPKAAGARNTEFISIPAGKCYCRRDYTQIMLFGMDLEKGESSIARGSGASPGLRLLLKLSHTATCRGLDLSSVEPTLLVPTTGTSCNDLPKQAELWGFWDDCAMAKSSRTACDFPRMYLDSNI